MDNRGSAYSAKKKRGVAPPGVQGVGGWERCDTAHF